LVHHRKSHVAAVVMIEPREFVTNPGVVNVVGAVEEDEDEDGDDRREDDERREDDDANDSREEETTDGQAITASEPDDQAKSVIEQVDEDEELTVGEEPNTNWMPSPPNELLEELDDE